MKTIYDVQQLLKKYGTIIYTGDRIGDLELMEMEINELFQLQFIGKQQYIEAKMLLRKKMTELQNKQGEKY
ncbi:hypothetical protein CIL03_02205 [Virgibacillus indicus]|uniref:Cytosolic protein n=1 Tax=Virgibacillus indicus TaxID=2024554 RepID=A0A265NET6_9BACI|nr:YqgQ family protein [Virgibacillus indicus]OZU89969.1 hypothetical protein CIL03_02205 [Virgibacillus indicus]